MRRNCFLNVASLGYAGAALAAAVLPSSAQAANSVANGDFANIGGVWVNNTGLGSDDWQTAGATAIPDWTNVPNAANEFWFTIPNSYNLTASPGNGSAFAVDLTGQANEQALRRS